MREERGEGEEERGEGRGEGGEGSSVHHHELFLSPLRHNVDDFVADIQTLEEGIPCLQQNLFIFSLSLSL